MVALEQNTVLAGFKAAYRDFNVESIGQLKAVYSQNILFKDPVHSLRGWSDLERYFIASAKNLKHCEFVFIDEVLTPGVAFYRWRMNFSHRKIAGGAPQQLDGGSLIKFDTAITYHEDFYDLGALVYEKLPLLGFVIHKIKARMRGH